MPTPELHFRDLSAYDAEAKRLMTVRGILRRNETVEDVFERVAGTLLAIDTELNHGKPDEVFLREVAGLIEDKTIVFGSPILSNIGRDQSTSAAACTVLPLPVREGVLQLEQFKITSQQFFEDAVGTGYDLSDIDEPVTALKGMNAFLKELNESLVARNKRPVAGMATLRVDHPKILEFIRAKQDEDFFQWCLNCSVFLTDDLFVKAERHQQIDLIDRKGDVVGQLAAQDIIDAIVQSAHYCGEPGILFRDRFEADNPTPDWKYVSTAPCAEVAMSDHEICQFSYVNLSALIREHDGKQGFDYEKLGQSARVLTRLLDASTQFTIDNDIYGREKIGAKRRIGVGIVGFAALLMNMGIPYDSPEAVSLAAKISEVIDFATKKESVELAKTRGPFPMVLQSRFADPEWVRRKFNRSTGIVSAEQWEELYDDIARHGIRHATTTAFPPSGISSRIVGTTQSFEPALELTKRTQNASDIIAERAVYDYVEKALLAYMGPDFEYLLSQIVHNGTALPDELLERVGRVFAVARQISFHSHLAIQAAFLQFADESGAKTINLPNATSIPEVHSIIQEARLLGLKGITVFRDKSLEERRIIL